MISIIALLIGILLPALGNAREASRGTVCLSNMRQIGIAVYAYTLDYDDTLPSIGFMHGATAPEQGAWLFALADYANGEILYRCPSDESIYWDTPSTATNRLRRVSYATNELLSGTNPAFQGYNQLTSIRNPTETIYVVELTEIEDSSFVSFATSDHVHPGDWTFPANLQTVSLQVEIEQHAEQANYLFLDGHAARADFEDTYELGSFAPKLNLYDPR